MHPSQNIICKKHKNEIAITPKCKDASNQVSKCSASGWPLDVTGKKKYTFKLSLRKFDLRQRSVMARVLIASNSTEMGWKDESTSISKPNEKDIFTEDLVRLTTDNVMEHRMPLAIEYHVVHARSSGTPECPLPFCLALFYAGTSKSQIFHWCE